MSRLTRTVAAAAVLSTLPMLALAASVEAGQPRGYGPADPFIQALLPSHGPVEPMKNQAKVVRTMHGYRLTAGQQNSHLKITLVGGKLRFRDTGTRSWKSLPPTCKAQRVSPGIAALCRPPSSTSTANPTLLEVHPRLGNDYVDGRSLPSAYQMAVLADAGRDTIFTGAGNDFINGAQNPDRAHGGPGNDWIRTGTGNDRIWGNAGNDYLVGAEGRDRIEGGPGADRVY